MQQQGWRLVTMPKSDFISKLFSRELETLPILCRRWWNATNSGPGLFIGCEVNGYGSYHVYSLLYCIVAHCYCYFLRLISQVWKADGNFVPLFQFALD